MCSFRSDIAALRRAAFGLLALVIGTAPLQAEPPSPSKPVDQGVVVLRNGEVLTGRVSHVEGGWKVIVAEGEIRLRASEVECCCDSLEQAYQRMHTALAPNSVYDHLRLAQWCVRQGLMDRAAQQIEESARIDPNHPMVNVLRRRLELAEKPPEQAKPPAKSDGPAVASGDELDRALHGLPPATVEVFVQRIQPILVNSCTASGCHGAQAAGSFHLLRTPSDRSPSRRVTQRNLLATLQWINRENPSASKLLTIPLERHGATKTPVFANPRSASYQRLAEWVNALSAGDAAAAPAVARAAIVPDPYATESDAAMAPLGNTAGVSDTPAAAVAQAHQAAARTVAPGTPAAGANAGAGSRASQKTTTGGARGEAAADPTANLPPESAAKPSNLRGGPRSRDFVPADPFDPEIYNRRYSGEQQ